MKADNELIEYLKKRAERTKEFTEKYEPHGDDRFKHIYHTGENSAFNELIMILEA